MAVNTEKRNKRQREWRKENKERMDLDFEKGTKARIDAACKALGVSRSAFVRDAITEKLKSLEK